MFCRQCGKEISNTVSFCRFCGSKVEKRPEIDETPVVDVVVDETPVNVCTPPVYNPPAEEEPSVKKEAPKLITTMRPPIPDNMKVSDAFKTAGDL